MMPELWIPWAVRDPAPTWKTSGDAPKSKTIYHSQGGTWAGSRPRLMGDAQVSWPLSVLYVGVLLQHYPLNANCWQSGDRDPVDGWMNQESVGVEFEGYHGGLDGFGNPFPWEPYTQPQFLTGVRLLRELRSLGILERFDRTLPGKTCYRHGEVVPTTCDGGRAPWPELIQAAELPLLAPEEEEEEEEEDMKFALFRSRGDPNKSYLKDPGGNLIRVSGPTDLKALTDAGLIANKDGKPAVLSDPFIKALGKPIEVDTELPG